MKYNYYTTRTRLPRKAKKALKKFGRKKALVHPPTSVFIESVNSWGDIVMVVLSTGERYFESPPPTMKYSNCYYKR